MNPLGEELGVVILSFGRAKTHLDLVSELIRDHGIPEDAILVVHNGYDADDSWLPEAIGRVRVIGTGDNLGYAGGMNVGIRAQLERHRCWVLCLTHEVRLGQGCVGWLGDAALASAELGIVGPQLTSARGAAAWSQGVMAIRGGMRHRTTLHDGERLAPCDSVDGSAMLIRAAAYEQAGPLDERMFMYWEETEFCLRVRRHGWTVAVATDATAVAAPGGAQRTAAHAYLTARNGLLYARQLSEHGAVRARLLRSMFEIWRDIPKPGGRRFRDRRMWAAAATRSRATLWGLVDYHRDRWGRPPPRLLRRSDISQPSRTDDRR